MTRVAAVDCGSNSTRLLIADVRGADGWGLDAVERRMIVTRLGRGVDASGRLDDAALRRTLDVVGSYAERWRQAGAKRVRISATSAVRDAADRQRFFEGIRERTGVDARVLSGEEEARTAFRGATTSATGPAPYLVLDIGGGSTEFILGTEAAEEMISRQLGCVRLTERCLSHDPPTTDELAAAGAVIDEELDAVEELIDATAAATLIGVAGTVTTLAALHLGLDEYDADQIHATVLARAAAGQLLEHLARIGSKRISESPVVAPGREDVLVGGALILVKVMERFGFGQVLVSEADILDGLALAAAQDRLTSP